MKYLDGRHAKFQSLVIRQTPRPWIQRRGPTAASEIPAGNVPGHVELDDSTDAAAFNAAPTLEGYGRDRLEALFDGRLPHVLSPGPKFTLIDPVVSYPFILDVAETDARVKALLAKSEHRDQDLCWVDIWLRYDALIQWLWRRRPAWAAYFKLLGKLDRLA